jgi:hypothetical protein
MLLICWYFVHAMKLNGWLPVVNTVVMKSDNSTQFFQKITSLTVIGV